MSFEDSNYFYLVEEWSQCLVKVMLDASFPGSQKLSATHLSLLDAFLMCQDPYVRYHPR
jgi:hypothetical protein